MHNFIYHNPYHEEFLFLKDKIYEMGEEKNGIQQAKTICLWSHMQVLVHVAINLAHMLMSAGKTFLSCTLMANAGKQLLLTAASGKSS